MRLSELLTAERIQTSLAVSSKAAVLDALAALLARGTDGVRPDEVARVLREREALASTGVGDEVAIRHGKLPGLKQLVESNLEHIDAGRTPPGLVDHVHGY